MTTPELIHISVTPRQLRFLAREQEISHIFESLIFAFSASKIPMNELFILLQRVEAIMNEIVTDEEAGGKTY